MVLKRA
jgi:hypothetical protein